MFLNYFFIIIVQFFRIQIPMIHSVKSTNIKRNFLLYAAILTIPFIWQACNKDKNIPDVSHIKVDLDLTRFEKEMYGIDSSEISAKAKEILEEHPDFSEIYTQIMRERDQRDSSQLFVMDWLMRGPQMKMLYDTCMAKYDDFSDYENQFEEAMRYFKYYFPEKEVPKIYTCITEFAYQGFTYGEDILVIGTEHFMGSGFPAYKSIFPNYQYSKFTPEHLVSSAIETLSGELIGEHTETNLLDAIIRNGKKLYLMDLMLPHSPDSIKLQYTGTQTQWTKENEFEIWSFLINEDLLYNSNRRDYTKYVMPGPHSQGMPPEAPGRVANYIGWQIIKRYMKMNPQKTLQDLLSNHDSQKILKDSKYKGKSK